MSMTVLQVKSSPSQLSVRGSESTSELFRRPVSSSSSNPPTKFMPDRRKSDHDFFSQTARESTSKESLSAKENEGESLDVGQCGDGSIQTKESDATNATLHYEIFPLLKQRLGHVWECKKFTDVIFKVGPEKEPVEGHRMVLASGSEVFQELLYDSKPLMVEDKLQLHEPDYSVAAFESFIKAFYTNELPISLNLPTALEVFYATKKYKVGFLQDQVLSHMRNSVTISNVFEALRISTNIAELAFMAPICWKVIESQTEDVLQYHLINIDARTFAKILERDQLNITEVKVFQFLVKWGAIQCKNRDLKTTGKNKRQFIEPLFKHIRFPTMSLADFNDIVVPTRTLEPKEIHEILVHINKVDTRLPVPYKTSARFHPIRISKSERLELNSEGEKSKTILLTAKSDSVVGKRTNEPPKNTLKRSSLSKFRSKRGSNQSTPRT